jgi:2,4-dienoyl-CoA reductase-like NADH-dependent reductase (Old Yellow Enzyme family)
MNATCASTLFSPVQLGPCTLQHRRVTAVLTCSRSAPLHDIPGNLRLECCGQGASQRNSTTSKATA